MSDIGGDSGFHGGWCASGWSVLPVGDWEVSFKELRTSVLVSGPGAGYPDWDVGWRMSLIDNLEVLVRQFWDVGIDRVFVDGSFAEDKDHPNDIDGYFSNATGSSSSRGNCRMT